MKFSAGMFVMVALASTAYGAGQCPDGFGHWYERGHQLNFQALFRPSCYKFVKTDMSWVQAKKNCVKLGGDLVTIETAAENAHLTAILRRYVWLQTPEIVEYRYWGYWTGGNDLALEGDWRWLHHNTRISYTDWGRDQPNNYFSGTEHCLHLRKDYDWKWNDLPCYVETQASICEIDALY